jgi:membrane protein implicated in regulation of membrane protease activity
VNRLRGLALGALEFVVGDDRLTALGVAVAIALTALLAQATVTAWLVMPLAVLLVLAFSIWRAVR